MTKGKSDLAVRRTATGLGLFTLKPIRAGRRIIEYKGPVVNSEEAAEIGGMYLFELYDGLSIDGRSRSNKARYINHSCNPNAQAYFSGRRLWIYAERAIEAGEAITIDYGKEYFDVNIKPKGCRCEACSLGEEPRLLRSATAHA